jgi:type II secretory pathway pseudopilin PulG
MTTGFFRCRVLFLILAAVILCLLSPAVLRAQDSQDTPAAALAEALSAACRANSAQFSGYLTADNAVAFRALLENQRSEFLKRLSLSDKPGKILVSSDPQKRTVLHCEAPDVTTEFRFGETRLRENLAFISVTAVNSERVTFGLVRESGGWKLLSLGLVLLDIPQLSKQWVEQDLAAREDAALSSLETIAEAVHTYRRAFGKLPESLRLMGPAPKDEISPDQAGLLNSGLAAGEQAGYDFRYRIVPAATEAEATFELAATPEKYDQTGRRSFFYDKDGRIHAADKHGSVASPDDPLLRAEKSQ